MIQIKPVQLGLPKKEGTLIFIRPIIDSTQAKSCSTFYEIFAQTKIINTNVDGETTESIQKESLLSGNCPISEEQYALWGTDNTYIDDIVMAFLGLERA